MCTVVFDLQRFATNGSSSNDTIRNTVASNVVYGYAGNDSITNSADDATIYGGVGNDTIYNDYSDGGDYVYIDGGAGNDRITNVEGYNVTISGGDGADILYNFTGSYASISGGAGTDSIYIDSAVGVTADGGNDADTIRVYHAKNSSINGGAGNDVISLKSSAGSLTVKGGAGNDTIYGDSLSSRGIVYQYTSGDGYDTIYGFKSRDTLSISTSYSTVRSGSDLIYYIGRSGSYTGSINLKNYYSSSTPTPTVGPVTLNNTVSAVSVRGSAYADSITNSGSYVSISAGDGNDKVYNNDGDNSYIDLGAGNDSLYGYDNDYVTVYAGAGNDTISGDYYGSKLYGGAGNDYFNGYYYTWSGSISVVDGGDGDDTINGIGGGSVIGGAGADRISLLSYGTYARTVKGGTDNDTIYGDSLGSAVLYQYARGDGNDVIYGHKTTDTIAITSGAYRRSTVGSNLVLDITSGANSTVSTGRITVTGGATRSINITGTQVTVGGGGGSSGSAVTLNNTSSYVSVRGSAYADSITNSGYKVSISAGDGNDKVYNNDGDNSYIDLGAGNDSLYGYDNDYVTVYAGAGNDTISGYYYDSKLYGGAGNDYFNGNYYWSSTVIDGGEGNDTINGIGGGSVNGGAGADRISLLSYGTYARTVKGGTDNDTIYGDSLGNAVLYQYARGDGNDVIYGHKSTDTIAITSGAYRRSTVGSNLVLDITSGANSTVSTGRITVTGGASRSINITGTQVTVGGSGRNTTPSATVSQQEVIKKFMGSLDTTSYSGISAVNQAVSVASGGYFKTAQAVIDAMVSDRNRAGSGNNFLLNYCGINLNNADTGAITGSDAGGSTTKTATSIVPESGSLIKFTGNSFTTKGLTVRLVNWDSSNNYTTTTVSRLNSAQKQIWQSFYTWWAGNGLDLIAESYGNNYGFTSSSSATAKTLYFGFVDDDDDALAWTLNGARYGYLGMAVNMDSYSNLSSTNVNGYDPISDQTYLDRTLAHELTHAVMMANISNYTSLPKYIKEGMAELTHGIDDERYTSINNLVANTTRMRQALVSSTGSVTVSGVSSPSYVGGYTFLRYLAKQGSAHYGQTASAYVAEDKNVSINGAVLTVTQNYQKNTIDLTAYDSSVKKVNASKLKNGVTIIGNEFANSIKGGAGNDSIHGNSGNDTLYGGAGDDYIYGDAGNNLLKGEAGNDTLFGAGNDTFTGGAGNDLFVYNAEATGNGVITDYSTGDSIQISGGKINNTVYSGRDVIFELGTSTLTVKNGKGKTIDISATDWITEDDNNFISDDAQISSITQENYSVTNVETVNYSVLLQNNLKLLTFAKK